MRYLADARKVQFTQFPAFHILLPIHVYVIMISVRLLGKPEVDKSEKNTSFNYNTDQNRRISVKYNLGDLLTTSIAAKP